MFPTSSNSPQVSPTQNNEVLNGRPLKKSGKNLLTHQNKMQKFRLRRLDQKKIREVQERPIAQKSTESPRLTQKELEKENQAKALEKLEKENQAVEKMWREMFPLLENPVPIADQEPQSYAFLERQQPAEYDEEGNLYVFKSRR